MSRTKKIISVMLAVLMIAGAFTAYWLTANAATWDGTTTTAPTGSGTEQIPYLISNGENLAWLSAQVKTGEKFESKYFTQTADIDLGGKDFASIGSYFSSTTDAKAFSGIYDGCGYKISNAVIKADGSTKIDANPTFPVYAAGIFGVVINGTVKNVNAVGVAVGTYDNNATSVQTIFSLTYTGVIAGIASNAVSGIIYCAHCGCRLTTSRYRGSYIREDGSLYQAEHGRYVCYHKSRGLNDCDGATTYNADKIDHAVMEAMRQIFASISGCPQEEKIQLAYKKMMAGNHHLQQKLEAEIQKDTKQLENLRAEIVKALSGDSVYTQEDLATALQTLRSKLVESQKKLEELKADDAEKRAMSDGIFPAYRQFRTWAVEFDESSFEAKKMIATQLFSKVEVGKGYVIHYELNFTYKQFCDEWMTINKNMTATG